MQEILIWDPATGITDLDVGWEDLSVSEIPRIKAIWRDQQERLEGTKIVSNFIERLSREWAIETGIIEGLYDIELKVKQILIDQGFREELLIFNSINCPQKLVLSLLNDQKLVLEDVFEFVKSERNFSIYYIKEIHAVLLRSQTFTEAINLLGRPVEMELIKGDWKKQSNSPTRNGMIFKYCPPEQVASEMERLVELYAGQVIREVPTEIRAAWLHHRFTQIHPFQDGNGQLARAITSFVLIKDGLFPFVVTREDRTAYLDALEAADCNDLKPLVNLIAELQKTQCTKAVAMSETVLF